MARWDERDPRWAVEAREDGTNVNGWHWQDRDRKVWAGERLEALLVGATSACGSARVTGVAIKEGEAYQATRKGGKRFSHFDLTLAVTYERVEDAGGGDGGAKGGATVTVSEFCAGAAAADLVLDPASAPALALAPALEAAAVALLEELDALAM